MSGARFLRVNNPLTAEERQSIETAAGALIRASDALNLALGSDYADSALEKFREGEDFLMLALEEIKGVGQVLFNATYSSPS